MERPPVYLGGIICTNLNRITKWEQGLCCLLFIDSEVNGLGRQYAVPEPFHLLVGQSLKRALLRILYTTI